MRSSATGQIRARGATVVEFAILAPFLFFLLFVVIELGVMFWVNLTMQFAVREGTRYAVTGQTGTGQPRYQAVIEKIRVNSMGLYDKVNPVIVVNGVAQAPGSYNDAMFGGPDSLIVLQLNCTWPVITPAWRLMAMFEGSTGTTDMSAGYRFSVAATMRSEAF
jgi:Flp pilus assembly protein TadG